jgi:hypothetical protein
MRALPALFGLKLDRVCLNAYSMLTWWGLLVQDGQTPLITAAIKGHVEVVSALLDAGAAVDLPDNVRHAPSCLQDSVYAYESTWAQVTEENVARTVCVQQPKKLPSSEDNCDRL